MEDELFGSDSDEQAADLSHEVRGSNNGVLSFHNGTEEAMFIYIDKKMQNSHKDCRKDVSKILSSCDEFCMKRHWMMHVGPSKANILRDAFNLLPPSSSSSAINVLELGSYCGYSTAIIAHLLYERDKGIENADTGLFDGLRRDINDCSGLRPQSHLVSV